MLGHIAVEGNVYANKIVRMGASTFLIRSETFISLGNYYFKEV